MNVTFNPVEVDDFDIVLGASGRINRLLPSMDVIPKEFHSHSHPICEVVASLFYSGGRLEQWKEKEGIDRSKALRHFKAVLGSFEPSHGHKISGCAYLLSLWFETDSLVYDKKAVKS